MLDIPFEFDNLPGWETGEPDRIIIHKDGNVNPHTALGALTWGNRERAFSIHYYLEDEKRYVCVPETWQAFHVLEARIAEQRGYRTTWPGLSKPRGDINAIGIECKMEPDGSLSQATRQNLVRCVADIWSRYPVPTDEHATWDPWTRSHDLGNALYVPDLLEDVRDMMSGLAPRRTVQEVATGTPAVTEPFPIEAPAPTTPDQVPMVDDPTLPKEDEITHQGIWKKLMQVERAIERIRLG
jgi:hypothetical protein